jgi:anti-sigma factor RsiW
MTCEELDSFLHPYLDGEFDAAERLAVEAHLSSCPPCAQRVASERHFLLSLKERLKGAATATPATLRSSIQEQIRTEQRRLTLASWGRWGAGALAAAAAFALYLHLRPSAHERLLEDAALRHAKRLPYEVQAASAAQVEAWFDGKLDYRVSVPNLPNATLTGARLSNVRERDAAYIGYQASLPSVAQPRRLSLFVLEDADDEPFAADWPDVEVRRVRGYQVATWRSAGMLYELVSDLDEPEFRRLLLRPALQVPGQPPQAAPGLISGQEAPALQVVPASLRH